MYLHYIIISNKVSFILDKFSTTQLFVYNKGTNTKHKKNAKKKFVRLQIITQCMYFVKN